uniref:Putative glycine-rich cell wall structural protein-like strongylocentrotus purpuratus n=1 Tax=Lutzomyia longipalpis TaxID=7200 RepID=A0A7G3ADE0_LUTLO
MPGKTFYGQLVSASRLTPDIPDDPESTCNRGRVVRDIGCSLVTRLLDAGVDFMKNGLKMRSIIRTQAPQNKDMKTAATTFHSFSGCSGSGRVGGSVGATVGSVVGASVSSVVGASVSSVVGASVTSVVGASVTSVVGSSVTSVVGSSVTSVVGSSVTSVVGSSVASVVGSSVVSVVGSSVVGSVGSVGSTSSLGIHSSSV